MNNTQVIEIVKPALEGDEPIFVTDLSLLLKNAAASVLEGDGVTKETKKVYELTFVAVLPERQVAQLFSEVHDLKIKVRVMPRSQGSMDMEV